MLTYLKYNYRYLLWFCKKEWQKVGELAVFLSMDDSTAISKTIRSGAIRLNSCWWKLQIWSLRGKDTMKHIQIDTSNKLLEHNVL